MAKKKSDRKEMATMVVATNVSQAVDGLKKKSSPLFKVVERFTIKSREDQEKLVNVLKQIKAYGKEAEKQQAGFVDPAKQIAAQAKTFFKPFLDSVDESTSLGKDKILEFINARLIASEAVGKKFEAGAIKKVSTIVTKQAELEDNNNTRRIWVLKITKPSVIPRKYLEPNEVLIREDLKKGKKISGCSLVQENTIAI